MGDFHISPDYKPTDLGQIQSPIGLLIQSAHITARFLPTTPREYSHDTVKPPRWWSASHITPWQKQTIHLTKVYMGISDDSAINQHRSAKSLRLRFARIVLSECDPVSTPLIGNIWENRLSYSYTWPALRPLHTPTDGISQATSRNSCWSSALTSNFVWRHQMFPGQDI